jgi:hypothetical protein
MLLTDPLCRLGQVFTKCSRTTFARFFYIFLRSPLMYYTVLQVVTKLPFVFHLIVKIDVSN